MTPRLFTTSELATGTIVVLDAAAAHHAVRVLRLGIGAAVELFDGQGLAAQAAMVATAPASAKVTALLPMQSQPELSLTLAQCISAADKMDWTIEKAVELGVAAIVPLQSQKGIVKLNPERATKRHEHWQRLVLAAAAQSGQNRLPRLDPVCRLNDWLRALPSRPDGGAGEIAASSGELRVILDPRAPQSLGGLLDRYDQAGKAPFAESSYHANRSTSLTLLCGPESGFSDAEYQAALDAGWDCAGLGPRVLRTETAGLAALAIVQARWGDLR